MVTLVGDGAETGHGDGENDGKGKNGATNEASWCVSPIVGA